MGYPKGLRPVGPLGYFVPNDPDAYSRCGSITRVSWMGTTGGWVIGPLLFAREAG